MKFIKLKDQIINAETIVKVDQPRSTAGVEWYIRTLLDITKTEEAYIKTMYSNKDEACSAYERIVQQLGEG